MQRSLHRPSKRLSSQHALAETAFREAHYDGCRRLIDAAVPADRSARGALSLLRARNARAQGDNARWYAAATAAIGELDDPQQRLLATVLRAGAAKALGKTKESRTLFEEAAREIFRFPSSDVGLVRGLLALDALDNNDFARAEALARENLQAGASAAESTALLGAIAFKRRRFADAGGHYAAALRRYTASGEVDVRLEAEIVSKLASVASSTVELRLLERARKASEKLGWTKDLAAFEFRAQSALRLGALLEGDVAGAFFAARRAVAVAPGPAEAALAETNAAAASRLLGDAGAERLQLRRAWETLREERWSAGDENARLALLCFIVEGAGLMPAEARKAMTLYRASSPKTHALSQSPDRCFTALEAQAAAKIAEAGGDDDAAIDLHERAFEDWRALGFDARAATVALDLRRLAGDDSYGSFVRSVLSRAPKAWFAKQLRAPASPVDLLSPAERVVLGYLINGDSAKAIAGKLDRSPFTISNHTRKIFQAFGLNSRGKVIARCAELGITSAKLER